MTGTPEGREVLSDMSSGAASEDMIIEDMDDLLDTPTCPECGYQGLEYDHELGAYVHDWCGYYKEQAEQIDDFDDYGGWLD